MKKFLIWALLPVALPLIFSSCDDNNDTEEPTNYWVEYAEWRKGNQAFFEEKYAETLPDGTLKYDRVTPSWNAGASLNYQTFHNAHNTVATTSTQWAYRIALLPF